MLTMTKRENSETNRIRGSSVGKHVRPSISVLDPRFHGDDDSGGLPPCGIDILLQDESLLTSLAKKKVALITNQNSLTQNYRLSAHALAEQLGDGLKCILTPEHGWSGFVAEGIKVGDGFDSTLGLPVFSLYGGGKKFLEFFQQESIDCLLIDLQDVGLRCYTYVSTCAKLLEACSTFPLEVMICDRPNPLGPAVRGPALEPQFRSLVGYVQTSFQHGQTMGELLSGINTKLPLTVIPCQPYHQPYHYPWIPPSPNLPSWEAALLYPSLVLLEGTNVSEGRGTSLPFSCLGAPGLNNDLLVEYLNSLEESGIRARPIIFTPQSSKHANVACNGVHILLTNPLNINAFALGIRIVHFLKETYPPFKWEGMINKKDEYFIDYLLGTSALRLGIEQGLGLKEILGELKV